MTIQQAPILVLVNSSPLLNNLMEEQLHLVFGDNLGLKKAADFFEALQLIDELQHEGRAVAGTILFFEPHSQQQAFTYLHHLSVASPAASCVVYASSLEEAIVAAAELAAVQPRIKVLHLPWGFEELNTLVSRMLLRYSEHVNALVV